MEKENKLIVFQDKKIRRVWHDEEWWFSVVDVVVALTNQDYQKARKYWNKLSQRLKEEGSESVTNCHQLKLKASDGKYYLTDCSNTENMFRIIQSISSPRAEPFKRWLAKVGYERVQEIENPELAQNRVKEYYELKGYPKEWVDKRLRGIAVRQELTEEWSQRGIEEQRDFAILTNEISKATFGKTVGEYKQFKSLQRKNQNLRDNMTDLELIFTMLGEASTTEIAKEKDTHGFSENKIVAKKGGKIAGDARKNLEIETGKKVITKDNYLHITEKRRKKVEDKNKN